MADFTPKEFDISQINGGKEFADGDGITPEAVNSPLESAAYMQGLVRNDNRPIVETDNEDTTTRVRFQKHTISGVDYPQFVFTNIKGAKGDTGAMALSLPIVQTYQQAPSSSGNISVSLSDFNRTPTVGDEISFYWYNEASGLTYLCDGTISAVSTSATVTYSNPRRVTGDQGAPGVGATVVQTSGIDQSGIPQGSDEEVMSQLAVSRLVIPLLTQLGSVKLRTYYGDRTKYKSLDSNSFPVPGIKSALSYSETKLDGSFIKNENFEINTGIIPGRGIKFQNYAKYLSTPDTTYGACAVELHDDIYARIANLENIVHDFLVDPAEEVFEELKSAVLPSVITVDNAVYPIADGANGILSSVKGNTKQFNQLVRNGIVNETISANGKSLPAFSIVNGHKYLIKIDNVSNLAGIRLTNFNASSHQWIYSPFTSQILTAGRTTDNCYPFLTSSDNTIATTVNLQVFDLTAMQEENTTVENFIEKYNKSYYPNNDGTLYNSKISGLALTGKNLWDEQWEVGNIDNRTGSNVSATGRIRCKNYIPVIGGLSYYCFQKSNYEVNMFAYDCDKTFIGVYASGNFVINSVGSSPVQNRSITLPQNCAFIKIKLDTTYGATYNNDICINRSNASFNGTYAPYALHTVNLPSAQTLGGVGTAQDEIQVTKNTNDDYYTIKKIKRVESVDLGSLSWSKNSDGNFYAALPSNSKTPYDYTVEPNAISAMYTYNSWAYGHNTIDKIYCFETTRIWVANLAYTYATTFKTAMNGVMLTYELGTPVETTITATATLAEVSAIRTNGGMISTVGNTNEDYAQPDVSEIVLYQKALLNS